MLNMLFVREERKKNHSYLVFSFFASFALFVLFVLFADNMVLICVYLRSSVDIFLILTLCASARKQALNHFYNPPLKSS